MYHQYNGQEIHTHTITTILTIDWPSLLENSQNHLHCLNIIQPFHSQLVYCNKSHEQVLVYNWAIYQLVSVYYGNCKCIENQQKTKQCNYLLIKYLRYNKKCLCLDEEYSVYSSID